MNEGLKELYMFVVEQIRPLQEKKQRGEALSSNEEDLYNFLDD